MQFNDWSSVHVNSPSTSLCDTANGRDDNERTTRSRAPSWEHRNICLLATKPKLQLRADAANSKPEFSLSWNTLAGCLAEIRQPVLGWIAAQAPLPVAITVQRTLFAKVCGRIVARHCFHCGLRVGEASAKGALGLSRSPIVAYCLAGPKQNALH